MAESLILEPVAQSAAAPTTASAFSPVVSVVVVGQVPPPMNGQSLMISEFLAGTYPGLQLEHVPMAFSRSTAEIGAFGFRKFGLLFVTLASIVRARFRTKAQILYYPPAGANLVPVLRDLFLLIPCRWLFPFTVFHFHAAGLHNIYPRLPKPFRVLFRLAYSKPDLAIFTTRSTSAEAALLDARATAIIPCGARDAGNSLRPDRTADDIPIILYAGILCDGKGLNTLLDACVPCCGTIAFLSAWFASEHFSPLLSAIRSRNSSAGTALSITSNSRGSLREKLSHKPSHLLQYSASQVTIPPKASESS